VATFAMMPTGNPARVGGRFRGAGIFSFAEYERAFDIAELPPVLIKPKPEFPIGPDLTFRPLGALGSNEMGVSSYTITMPARSLR
jgi:hypothetical protein